jgi:hypothetical protein
LGKPARARGSGARDARNLPLGTLSWSPDVLEPHKVNCLKLRGDFLMHGVVLQIRVFGRRSRATSMRTTTLVAGACWHHYYSCCDSVACAALDLCRVPCDSRAVLSGGMTPLDPIPIPPA